MRFFIRSIFFLAFSLFAMLFYFSYEFYVKKIDYSWVDSLSDHCISTAGKSDVYERSFSMGVFPEEIRLMKERYCRDNTYECAMKNAVISNLMISKGESEDQVFNYKSIVDKYYSNKMDYRYLFLNLFHGFSYENYNFFEGLASGQISLSHLDKSNLVHGVETCHAITSILVDIFFEQHDYVGFFYAVKHNSIQGFSSNIFYPR